MAQYGMGEMFDTSPLALLVLSSCKVLGRPDVGIPWRALLCDRGLTLEIIELATVVKEVDEPVLPRRGL